MGKHRGFLEYDREQVALRPRQLRVLDWQEVQDNLSEDKARTQGARCMDCGTPFCNSGCPLGNIIPDWNDLVYRGRWREALTHLHRTNNFPEFTGMVCPAPCEASCVLGINDSPVTIRQLEWEIVRHGFDQGWVEDHPPPHKTGKRVAIVGSGPAGLAAAQQLNRAGHTVVVFEKADKPGGILRYGIPDFKLEKSVLDRRLDQLRREGVEFRTSVHVGVDVPARQLVVEFDALLLAGGSETPRDIDVPGRELAGIHFAMDYLPQQNKRCAGQTTDPAKDILATNKHVIIIGGGDTGSDCVGTALRQGAKSVTSLELLPRPPEARPPSTPWPMWPQIYRVSSSHDEGGNRFFGVLTKAFTGSEGRVDRVQVVPVYACTDDQGRPKLEEVKGTAFELQADLVLLAMGFTHPAHDGMLRELGVSLDGRGNVLTDIKNHATSVPKVFAAGDMRRGQSLVVWAIQEGRQAAKAIDRALSQDEQVSSTSATAAQPPGEEQGERRLLAQYG